MFADLAVRAGRSLALAAIGLLASQTPAVARQPADPPERVVVAKATSPAATFAARPAGGDGFKVLPENAELSTGDLLVTLPGAALASKNGAAALKSLADYDGKSPLPALETALTLNDPKGVDLDVTLDRGRIDLTNAKAEGAAVARVRFWDQSWKVTLDAPGTRVAFELCGRWPEGARFKMAAVTDSGKPLAPAATLLFLVLSGSAAADVGGVTLGLRAPPGPALVEWDSVGGARPQPQKLDKLPDWADPEAGLSADGKKAAAAVEKFRAARAENPAAAVETFLASADPFEQRVALVTLGATDDLAALGRQLGAAKSLGAWDFAVAVARHWLGRGPGNDQKLYAALTSPAQGYSPAHAKIILQLLLGFTPDDAGQPETYEVLIDYLAHDAGAVRNLAAWHLVRMVPQGKVIAFDPAGTKADCDAAYRAWKKLVPAGQLPPTGAKKD